MPHRIDTTYPDLHQTMPVFFTAVRIHTAKCPNAQHSIAVEPMNAH